MRPATAAPIAISLPTKSAGGDLGWYLVASLEDGDSNDLHNCGRGEERATLSSTIRLPLGAWPTILRVAGRLRGEDAVADGEVGRDVSDSTYDMPVTARIWRW